ncbi:MAG TPA: carboxypeptidase-like regulatory domain-containing protein, partial [Longimicrobiales bacterium]|nr:carboxypeptidase-like regulatory domain-containing protein [Longimicrobiales bacterium]
MNRGTSPDHMPDAPLSVTIGVAVVALLLVCGPLAAQTPVVVDVRLLGEDGTAITNALVRALDAAGDTVTGQITNADGRARIILPRPGRYQFVVHHVRYQDWSSGLVDVDAATGTLEFRLPERAIVIEGVDALTDRRCDTPPEEGPAILRMYELMQVALGKVVEAERGRTFRVREIYQRATFIRVNGRRRWNDTTWVEVERPAATYPAHMLQRYGWASGRVGSNDRPVYSLPTADVLTSEAFRATHCFRVVAQGDSGWTGLRFDPDADSRLIDVRGTVWLDTLQHRPVRVDFRYTDLTEMMQRTEAPIVRAQVELILQRWVERHSNRARASYYTAHVAREMTIPWVLERGFG